MPAPLRGNFIASPLLAIKACMRDRDAAWRPLFEGVGIDPEHPCAVDDVVAFSQLLELFERLAVVANDRSIGLRLGVRAPVDRTGIFSYVAVMAPTVRAALQNWSRYHLLVADAYDDHFFETKDHGVLEWRIPDYFGPRTQLADFVKGYAYARLSQMLGDRLQGLRFEFAHKRPANGEAYEALLRSELSFEQPVDRVLIPRPLLDLPPLECDPNLYVLMERQAAIELEKQEQARDILQTITRNIASELNVAPPSLERLADGMGTSVRSLQRVLNDRGTSFRVLVMEIRKGIARRFLCDTDMPLAEISYRLGFSEQSVFTRAMSEWFGVTPLEYRRKCGC